MIASLDEISNYSHEDLDTLLHIELSSLLEKKENLPPVDFESIRKQVIELMSDYGKPKYNGQIHLNFEMNERGELVLGNDVIDDGEEVEWI